MSEQDPVIQQRSQSPPGNIPRGRQFWVMIAVAVVIVLAVVFSGSTSPSSKDSQNLPSMAVNTTTKAEIDRYTVALRAEEARLKAAQEDAARGRAAYQQQINTGMQGGIAGEGVMGPNGQAYYPAAGYPQQPVVNPIEQDREKREYASLFASNMALSYRKDGQTPVSAGDTDIATVQPVNTPATQAEQNPAASPASHMLFEGTILEAVLTNRLEGSFAGPVNCQLTTHVYSGDRQHLLIPKGSRVLGEARRVEDKDQQRLAVMFHRLIMPDGYSVNLDRMLGLDQAGASALKDKVSRHYLSTFGTSIALGLLAGFSMYGTGGVFTADASDMYRQGIANQLGRDAARILDRQTNRLPEVQIREGHRVKILLANDIALPAYNQHSPITRTVRR